MSRQAPEARPDLLATALGNVVGIALIVVVWAVTSGQPAVGTQLPYINLAVGGVIVAGAGNALYLLGMRRAVHRRRQRLLGHRRMVP
jgi:hypothetical protein